MTVALYRLVEVPFWAAELCILFLLVFAFTLGYSHRPLALC